jgi:hypothetical protein
MLVLRSREALVDLIIRKRSWFHSAGCGLVLQPSFSRTLLEHIRNNVRYTLSTMHDGGIPQAYNVWDMTVRQARFTFASPIVDRYLFEQASPFVSNEVVDWALTMPLPHLFLQRAYLRAILILAPQLAQVPWARTGHPLPRHLLARVVGEVERRIARKFSAKSRNPPQAAIQPRLASPELLSTLERWCQSDTFMPDVFESSGVREAARRYLAGDAMLENTVATLLTIATSAQLFVEGDVLQPPPAVQPMLVS